MKPLTKLFLITGLSLSFFALDRGVKLLMEFSLSDGDIKLLGDWLRFTLHYNSNLALSIPFPLFAQISFSIILLGVLVRYFWKKPGESIWEMISIALIFGGALGNLSDRILLNKVVDFIAVWKFPIFNLADAFLFWGVSFFLWKELRTSQSENRKHADGSTDLTES